MPRPSRKSRRGFSLVEVLVVLVLLSLAVGAAAPLLQQQITASKRRATLDKLERLHAGLAGDPARGDYGYLGDFGVLPPTLADLNTSAAKPAYVVDAGYGIGAGYNGPYAPRVQSYQDAWSRDLDYTAGVAQVTSAGPDRILGNGDDLRYPPLAPTLTGDLTVVVRGVPAGGGSEVSLTSAEVLAFVASAVNGVRTESALSGSGPFTASGLPHGLHGVRLAGQGSYLGVNLLHVVEIRRGSTLVNLVLEEP